MALGPKAMGEAIIANLAAKTGKDARAWLAQLKKLNPTDKKDAAAKLMTLGLGRFQAVAVAELHYGSSAYNSPDALVDALFAAYPEQRRLYDDVCRQVIDGKVLRLQPCRGYVPVYSHKNVIVASFKPTRNGLYIGLRGSGFAFDTVPHKASLGGSEAMREGVYVTEVAAAVAAITAAGSQRA